MPTMSAMTTVIPIPALDDNYIWLIHDGHCAAVVDPGEAEPVLAHLDRHGLRLIAVLNTHHQDHVGGNAELVRYAPVPVYGPRHEDIATVTHPIGEGGMVRLTELSLELAVLEIPGHTAGHLAYYGANHLFCGDTLFACGCGKVFEGTPAQMHASLDRLARLPDDTKVCCAHEYTLANIRFARQVEPDNPALAAREEHDRRLREQGLPTVPSTIRLEKATNPFLRCADPGVAAAAGRWAGHALDSPVEVFTALRAWKP
jgi:hydroxyacylglutathione hydrolase